MIYNENKLARNKKFVHGVPCNLKSWQVRHAIEKVLNRLKKKFPKDYKRIRSRVEYFSALSKLEMRDGTEGHWKARDVDEKTFWQNSAFYFDPDNNPGEVLLKDAVHKNAIANVAHELGHVCTREKDRQRRRNLFNSEWISEMCADYYAYKWGFGRQIERGRKTRDFRHHGPGPGDVVAGYRVTKNFFLRVLSKKKGAG